MKINKLLVALTVVVLAGCGTTRIDTSQIFVPEEGGIKFTQVTDLADDSPIIPNITYDGQRLRWWANPYFAISSDGQKFAYISTHNGRRNIFVKPFSSRTGAQQRTFSGNVQDPCFSPNGDTLCFTQYDYPYYNIFLTRGQDGVGAGARLAD